MIELGMYMVQQVFLGEQAKVLLRVKIEIEQNSNGYEKVADLKVVSK